MEIEPDHAAFLARTGLVHFATKGHGMQRDVVTVGATHTHTQRVTWYGMVVVVEHTDCKHAGAGMEYRENQDRAKDIR